MMVNLNLLFRVVRRCGLSNKFYNGNGLDISDIYRILLYVNQVRDDINIGGILKYLSTYRLDEECRGIICNYIKLYGLQEDLEEELTKYFKYFYDIIMNSLPDRRFKGDTLIYDSSLSDGVRWSLEDSFARFKSVVGDIHKIGIPYFTYILHLYNFLRDIDIPPLNIDSILNRILDCVDGRLILFDSYDRYVFNTHVKGVEVISLSEYLSNILESGLIYFKRLPELEIGVIKFLSNILKKDLELYKLIFEYLPAISIIESLKPIQSIYFNVLSIYSPDIKYDPGWILNLFSDPPKIILSIDQYFLEYFYKAFKGKYYIIGSLPQFIFGLIVKGVG